MAFIVSLEGNIGSGKSTFLDELKLFYSTHPTNYNLDFIQEPVDEWNLIKDSSGESILEKFYTNQEEYAFSFQIMAYITRLRKLIDAIELGTNSIYICERSLETDKFVFAKMLYDNKKIREIDWNIYNYWFNTFLEKVTTNLIIYFKTSPEICHTRIISRNRKGEDNIPLEYLQNCHMYHEQWLQQSNVKIVTIDGNINKDNIRTYTSLLESAFNVIDNTYNK
jgi:deoxyadenosine/deoxycytidine kinase